MKKIITAAAIYLISSMSVAGGSGLTGGATEFTQIANNDELIRIYGKEAQQASNQIISLANENQMILNQLEMIQNLLDNTNNLSSFQWGQVFNELKNLSIVVRQGNAIAYSSPNMDEQWQQRYQDYGNYLVNTYGASNFQNDYNKWYTTQRDSLYGALLSANMQWSQYDMEEATLNTLENMSQTANGRMQAIQVGNQISMQMVRQTQKLRELMMAIIQALTNYMATESAKDAANQTRAERWSSALSTAVAGNGQAYDPSNW